MSARQPTHHVNKWIVLTLVCMAQFMVILDATVVNVAMPSIQRSLGFTFSDLQWIINAYTLTFGGFLLLGGRAGDLLGRQRVFLTGLVIFTVASMFNGLAQSHGMLIVGRAVQGFGGALISPAALAIITSTFDEGDDRNKALGAWSAIAASGAAFGLLIGGVLTQALSWRWAFFINGPVGLITGLLALRLVPNSRVHGQRGADVAGAIAVTAGLMLLVFALASVTTVDATGQAYGWGSLRVLGWGGLGLALLAAFVVIEKTYHAPLVRLSAFRSRSLTGANLAMFLVSGGMFAMFYFLSLYVQNILRYSPIQAGFAFLPFCAGIGIGAGLASQLIKRIDVRAITASGLAVAATGFLLLTGTQATSGYVTAMLIPLLVMSLGMGMTFVPVTLLATTNIDADDAGLASGLLNTSQQIGGALGLAILATLAQATTNSAMAHAPGDIAGGVLAGFHAAYLAGAILVVSAIAVIAGVIRRSDVATIGGVTADEDEEAVA